MLCLRAFSYLRKLLNGDITARQAGSARGQIWGIVTLSTVIMLSRGFGMTVTEFLDDEVFRLEALDIEQ